MQCPYHKRVHQANEDNHEGCISHGHCLNPLQCTVWHQCPGLIVKVTCRYHNVIHDKNEYQQHVGCVNHGHCLNPRQCPLFNTCPAHIGGKNLFLAWSCK